jgi:hypothetical protein
MKDDASDIKFNDKVGIEEVFDTIGHCMCPGKFYNVARVSDILDITTITEHRDNLSRHPEIERKTFVEVTYPGEVETQILRPCEVKKWNPSMTKANNNFKKLYKKVTGEQITKI